MCRAAVAVSLLLVSAAPLRAEPLFGTTGDLRGVWFFRDNEGRHIGQEADCVRGRNPAFCGPGHLAFTTAFASGTAEQELGLISTHLAVAAPDIHPFLLEATAEFRGFWFDTFTIAAPALAFGTPIDVRLRIDLDGPVVAPSQTGAPPPRQRLQAQINVGGPDAPGSAFTNLLASGASSTEGHLQFLWDPTSPHLTFPLFGGLYALTDMNPPVVGGDSGEILGSARYYVDVLTPGATLTNASGHDFSVPRPSVPEPSSLAFLLVAGAGAGLLRRRRHAPSTSTSTRRL